MLLKEANILVVDDEVNIRFFLEEILTRDGYRVVTAENGEQALQRMEGEEFDLALIDLRMPKLDGLGLLAQLRQRTPDTVVIILTAHGTLNTAVEALRQGAYDYQLKPCQATELRASVQRGLNKRKAETRSKHTSKVVAEASHDMRNLVTNIGVYTELLEPYVSEQKTEYLNVLKSQVGQLANLTNNVLDEARPKVERQPEQFAPVDLNPLAWQVVADNTPRAAAAGLQLTFEPQTGLPPVRAQQSELARLLNNLIANAIKYTPSGHVIISTYLSPNQQQACLQVEDTGLGITDDERAYLFDRYYRSPRVADKVSGSGLGLAIVKEIVEAHGGKIEVYGRADHGSIFKIWLPLCV